MIPLEYFRDCINKIRAQPELRNRKAFLQGTSKGAEASLLLCSYQLVEVDGAILISPSRYIWGASADLDDLITGKVVEESSWSWEGNPVEFVPFNLDQPSAPSIKEIEGASCFVFRDTWYPKLSGSLGQIELSNLATKLLIFSGRDDDLWPSYRAGCEIENTLKLHGIGNLAKHVSFQNVGHQIPYPGKEPSMYLSHPHLGYSISYGGKVNDIREASQIWWNEVQAFMNNNS